MKWIDGADPLSDAPLAHDALELWRQTACLPACTNVRARVHVHAHVCVRMASAMLRCDLRDEMHFD